MAGAQIGGTIAGPVGALLLGGIGAIGGYIYIVREQISMYGEVINLIVTGIL